MYNNPEITGRFLLTMGDGEVLEMELNGICMGWTLKPPKGVIAYKSHTLFSSKNKQKIEALWNYWLKNVLSKENIELVAEGEYIVVEISKHLLKEVKLHRLYKRKKP